jgi:signal-transduction protein with cAMP-binding, CBS, and nucleotidyltransferase domain
MRCTVEALVSEVAVTLEEYASVQRAAQLMAERNLGSLVITRDGRVSGLFTESDLLRRVVGVERDPAAVSVGEVCTRNLVSVPYDSECLRAIAKMQAHRCRRLLVFRGERLLGLVHITDLAHALADKGRRKDLLVNLVGTVTLAVAIGVIVMLVYAFPDMLRLAEGVLAR